MGFKNKKKEPKFFQPANLFGSPPNITDILRMQGLKSN
jgi:hypothetical protein